MALADNDRISSNALNTVISALWTKIKNLFLSKSDFDDSPAGKILEVEYGSSTYTYQQLKEFYKAGYTIYVVSSVDDSSGSAGFNKLRMVGYNDVQSATPTAYFFSEYNPSNNASTVATLQIVNGQEYWNSFVSSLSYSSLKNKDHSHAASDITSGTLPDARIASASTWNGKMNSSGSNATASGIGNIIQKAQYYTASDFPTNLGDPQIGVLFRDTSGDVNSSGRINLENFESLLKSDIKEWPSAQELYKSDRGNVWFMSCSKNQVYRLTMPSNKDCGLASLFVHTTAANGWPLIFQVGWRWGGSSFSAVPHLAYIYTTSQNSEDKMVTVKYSGDCLYICINQTQTQRRALFSLISDNVDSIEFDVISQTLSDYTQATAVAAGNTEGCVMKESIGTKIGDVNRPVYVNEAGFIRPCNYYFS